MRHRLAAFLFLGLFHLAVAASPAEPLPVEISRFNPAGLDKAWAFEGRVFSVLRQTAPDIASHAVVRLRHPQRGFLLTASAIEIEHAIRTGFIKQGVAFHTPRQSALPIYRFRDKLDGSFYYASQSDAVAESQFLNEGVAFYGLDAPQLAAMAASGVAAVSMYRHVSSRQYFFTAGKESPYQIGAYYFGAFSPSSKQQIAGTSKVYGRKDDWWGGVSDFYGGESGVAQNTRKWAGDFSTLKPAIGYYNQEATETLAKHIEQAADAGLTFFSFYWYWSNQRNGELLPEALAAFRKANTAARLKFNISFYAHPWDADMVIDKANTEKIVEKIVDYFGDPNYLRLPDGRPVFVMGDHRNILDLGGKKCTEVVCHLKAVDQFLAILKETSRRKLGVSPFVQVQAGAPGWSSAGEVDSVTCLVPPIPFKAGAPYPRLGKETFSQLANAKKPVSACMFQNFDERPRQDVLVADRAAIRYFVGKTADGFRHNLEMTKQYADAAYQTQKHPATRIIYLYAWNEWHEGGILEPNTATGARDLNVVTDVFQLPRSYSRCLELVQC